MEWSRSYSNDLAYDLSGSSNMPIGWSQPYDVQLESFGYPDEWAAISMSYPNGSNDVWDSTTPDINNKMTFTVPEDAPYTVVADADPLTHTYSNITLTWSDGTVWGFSPSGGNPDLALLTSIKAATSTSANSQKLILHWDSSGLGDDRYRLAFITDQSSNHLLDLTYTSSGNTIIGDWLTQVTDCYGRKIVYTNGLLSTATQPYPS